ncbi:MULTISPECIES: nitroreductase family protein [Solibacillus]|uniref:Nitroreductase family protein n=1 Tax=Solibacillus palustris TaxID=2908203 RepID=A0ABS9UHE6_9BACL|nr:MULTISPECIES: nitroreductase family protein [Solibacillus]MCH7323350.1 nitroreductase family protein [Solibacillus sp. MA9]
MTFQAKEFRTAEHDIADVFLNRWSPRAYADTPVAEEVLNRLFEAARWAPSSGNNQPWRFIVAKTEEDLAKFHPVLMEGNLVWAKNAPVLVLVVSDNTKGSHEFDAGTAWGFLSLQAANEGLVTHPMSGIYKDVAKEAFNIPETFDVHLAIAIGYKGDKEMLSPELQQRETPSGRRPLEEIVFEGSFK